MAIHIGTILRAFSEFGDDVVPEQALPSRLEAMGFSPEDVVDSLNDAIRAGHLLQTGVNSLKRP
ncbi:hypothetical protein [Burkholderia contaminans]|uniref:Uncharacterized protein n=1 Tax=Burkholderia contaminans TaxID=488447 RepID=A0A6P3BS31_9BURK|nr:hypothetical protein [Burkholderia contaminans]VWD62361.1 hypothetical protein BCO71033_06748 [Burkholderia contaminans]